MHPDAKKQITVYIESWLNDDDFNKAKEEGRLFVPGEENLADSPPKVFYTVNYHFRQSPLHNNIDPREERRERATVASMDKRFEQTDQRT